MIYPGVTHRIPDAFVRKIELDERWDEMKASKVVDIKLFLKLRAERLLARDKCAMHCKRQRGGTGGTA